MGKSDDEVRAELRASVMRFAVGCKESDADDLLDVICRGWGMRLGQLPGMLAMLVTPELGMNLNPVLMWLYSTVQMGRTEAGRKLIRQAAETLTHVDASSAAPFN